MYNRADSKGGHKMRVLLQRVTHASCTVDNQCTGKIDTGYLALVGITHEDNIEIIEKMASKVINLRVFSDADDKMNLSLQDIKGSVLSISQFTLYADCRKGRRPGFEKSAKPVQAQPLYEAFNDALRKEGILVETGLFGADMKIELLNDGPVTIMLDSDEVIR